MTLRTTFKQTEAGGRLIAIEDRVQSIVARISQTKADAVALRDEVQANADGFYENPGDLAEVTVVLQQLQADLQAAVA